MTYSKPEPPNQEGKWTLLQSQLEASFWQWDRSTSDGILTRFVILQAGQQLIYDTFDEAETLYEALNEDDDRERPQLDLTTL